MLVLRRVAKGSANSNVGQSGFTIIELMMATFAFSVVLLIASNAIVQIGRMYYKGQIQSRTQETARNISEEVTRSFQFTGGRYVPVSPDVADGWPDNQQQFCINDTRYTVFIDQQVRSGVQGLNAKRLNAADQCKGVADGRELLGENMRVLHFEVNELDPKTFLIDIRLAYGDNDLLTHYPDNAAEDTDPIDAPDDATCKSGVAGNHFCATSRLDNIVRKRLN